MPALATDILTAVKGQLASLYPSLVLKVQKRPDYAGGDPPFLIVAMPDPEPAEDLWAGAVAVKYPVYVAYVKNYEPGQIETGETPDDPDVREKRQAIRRRLHKPGLAGVAAVNDCFYEGRGAYEPQPAKRGGPGVVRSLQLFRFEAIEPRSDGD